MPLSDLVRLSGAAATGLRGSMQDLAAFNKQTADERHQAALERNAAAYIEIAKAKEMRDAAQSEDSLRKLKQENEAREIQLKRAREQEVMGEQLVTAGVVVPQLAHPKHGRRLNEIATAIEKAGGEVERVDPEDPATWRVQAKYVDYIKGLVNDKDFATKMNDATLEDLRGLYLDAVINLRKIREKGDPEKIKQAQAVVDQINKDNKIAQDVAKDLVAAEKKGALSMAKEIMKEEARDKRLGITGQQKSNLEAQKQLNRIELAKLKNRLTLSARTAGMKPKDQLIFLDMTIGYQNMTPEQQNAYDRVIGDPEGRKLRDTIAKILGPNLLFQTEDPMDAVKLFMHATETASAQSAQTPKVPGRPLPPKPGSKGVPSTAVAKETKAKFPNLKGQALIDAVYDDLAKQGYDLTGIARK